MSFSFSNLKARRSAVAACGLSVLLLSGCAVNTSVVDPLKMSAQSGDSPVVLSITSNTKDIYGFNTIKLRRVVAGEQRSDFKLVSENLVMKKVESAMAGDTSLFIGALPPGEYEFIELIDTRANKLLRVYSTIVGSFQIEAGKSADLGRLIVTRGNFGVQYGRSAQVASNAELIRRFAPDYSAMFGAAASLGWSTPRHARDDVEQFARAHPAGAECVTEMPDGRVAATSRMGAVLIRSTQGLWKVINAQTVESLSCVFPVDLPNAELIAVGESGSLLRKARDSDKLLPIDAGNLPPGNLLRIGGNSNDGWYVMHRKGDELNIFHANQLDAGDWRSVYHTTVPGSWLHGPGLFWTWQDAGRIGYALESGLIGEFDYRTGKLTERFSPHKKNLTEFTHQANGTESVLVAAGLAGRFPDAYVSRDRGQNWTTIVSPFKVLMSPVAPLNDGRLLMEAGMYNEGALLVSSDEGKTWGPYAPYTLRHTPLIFPSGLALSIQEDFKGNVSIYSSMDNARTWKLEHSNQDLLSTLQQLKQ
ncbi:hypothetical protein JAB5_21770 [Janthinobacterium sp. HH103]|uniref:hypothetical protein n=1 Tax=unclassified Janthinobacterium TaxID=2610881 RepID=UPI0008756B67|nr:MULTISPECIES: hypothetical protein [unclassified Janthinobacterium]OEZ68224.1 hypothetical protein JAB2_18460 [Janthinobacterium sp. HH100]OEZ79590.1 hypothetical protein JAB5_21770 [Janthinobacterium sp. HH103]QOU74195.1 hypothetical protein JAB4_036560 [Janthinobacterium sp. HH102]